MSERPGPIVLYDGVCKFCDGSVNFIIDHDCHGRVHFAALQSAAGQRLLRRFGLSRTRLDSLVLVEGHRCSQRSTAALRIAAYLDGRLSWLGALLLVPTFLRDYVYDWVAANRYRWFGQLDACRVPTPDVRRRFVEA